MSLMTLNEKLFIIVPLISLLCNAFLFLTCLSAKKNRTIIAFLELLAVFTCWCGGSLFMRMEMFPGPDFWYEVSIMGIFLVPYFIYNFIYHFCEMRGTFVRTILLICWVIFTAMNLMHVFITDPHVTTVNGEKFFDFGVSPLIAAPILLAVFTLYMAGRSIVLAVRADRMPANYFRPLIVGVVIMFLGTVADVFPIMVSLPNDTFSCGLNALCLYYALYKKRIITLTHITSSGSTYLVSALLTTVTLSAAYPSIDRMYNQYFSNFMDYKTIVIAVAFSLLTMLVYSLVRMLTNDLFVRHMEQQEGELKQFSSAIAKTLDLNEILHTYTDFISRNLTGVNAYVCLKDPRTGDFTCLASTSPLYDNSLRLSASHPLILWLSHYNRGMYYSEFSRSSLCKSMWESEKRLLGDLKTDFVVPLNSDGGMTGVTLFSSEVLGHTFTYNDVNFAESMAAVLSIALKNASLYTGIQHEARCDSLTGLYNRRYFQERVAQDFEKCRHDCAVLILFNLDDFHLYNELYGTAAGDDILRRFADGLRALVGSRGVYARYGAKEFALFLPFGDVAAARSYADQMKNWLAGVLNEENGESRSQIRKFLTFSAGVCPYPTAAATTDQLFTYAGMAVYGAKKDGKNRVVVYSAQSSKQDGDASFASKQAIGQSCTPTIFALTAAVDAKDHYTFNHSVNVSEYASELALAIPLDGEHVEIIRQAGLLHDIGKIGIPDKILSKTSRLTKEEYDIMKQHVEGSISMIRHLPSMDYVIPSVIGHHERFDGHGYPRGLAGEEIPIGARCLCLADSFDAMISRRSYKEPMQVSDALEEIRRNLGTQFDPHLGQLFIQLVQSGRIRIDAGLQNLGTAQRLVPDSTSFAASVPDEDAAAPADPAAANPASASGASPAPAAPVPAASVPPVPVPAASVPPVPAPDASVPPVPAPGTVVGGAPNV